MRRSNLSFREALWATRAGNIFTTHTPVAAGFDRFPADALAKYARYVEGFLAEAGIGLDEFLALGRARYGDENEPFNMAYLAIRGSMQTFGVSRLHGQVSRHIFQPLFPRWPEDEVPVGHVTNGVHVPSWDSSRADELWTAACGKERWRGVPDALPELIASLSDEQLWTMASEERQILIRQVRARLARQLGSRGYPPEIVAQSANVLDPNALTLGFARRFTGYKRPNLLLADPARLARLLNDPARPVQLVLAGKAHPADDVGREMIREWIDLAQRPEFRQRVVFLEDYDIALAQELVQGVDVWINTPRRPWEACGTSGMKVLVNGGLNLSERDGWWEEAYAPELGWAIGNDGERPEGEGDAEDAEALYAILEQEVVPEFYARDAAGMPRRWLERVRRSMASLTRPIAAAAWHAIMSSSTTSSGQRSCAVALPTGVSRHGRCMLGSLGCAGTGRGFTSGKRAFAVTAPRGLSRCRSISARLHPATWRFSSTWIRATARNASSANSFAASRSLARQTVISIPGRRRRRDARKSTPCESSPIFRVYGCPPSFR